MRSMKIISQNKLYCFSPPVMLATFAIEILLAVYVIWRYRFDERTKIIAALLVLLAVFQLAEYNVCEGSFGISSISWSRLGFMAISFLPALGLHLAQSLAADKKRSLSYGGYAMAVAFALFFGLTPVGITDSQCLGNYVIFKQAPLSVVFYTIYYYGWMLVGTVYAVQAAKMAKNRVVVQSLWGLIIGYLALFIPVTLVNLFDPATMGGIPSIMCGFAVILAVTMGVYVAPRASKRRS